MGHCDPRGFSASIFFLLLCIQFLNNEVVQLSMIFLLPWYRKPLGVFSRRVSLICFVLLL